MANSDDGWHEMFSEEGILEPKKYRKEKHEEGISKPIIWHKGLEKCSENEARVVGGIASQEVYRTPGREIYWMLEDCVVLHKHDGHTDWHPAMRPHERRVKNGCAEHLHYMKTKYGYSSFWHPIKRVHRTIFEC